MKKVSPVTGQEGYLSEGWGVTSGYAAPGYFQQFGAWHTGHDLARTFEGGEPIYAVADGTVRFAEFAGHGGFGNLIFLRHNDNLFTRYAHLREIFVRRNEEVSAGQIIGLLGTTGRSTGNHLHFDIMIFSNALDWPGTNRDRTLREYIDPAVWFGDAFTIASAPGESEKMRIIATAGLNIRSRPTTTGPIMYRLGHHAVLDVKPVRIHANDLAWRELASGGWVAEKFLELVAKNGHENEG